MIDQKLKIKIHQLRSQKEQTHKINKTRKCIQETARRNRKG